MCASSIATGLMLSEYSKLDIKRQSAKIYSIAPFVNADC